MKTFKSYSPLPASLRPCTLNCRRISEGAAAAARQPEANTFNGFPLIEKICLHLLFLFSPRLGECKRRWKRNECCELKWRRREERTLQMVSTVEKPGGGQGGNDDKLFQQTNAIRGWPPSWLLRGQTILTPPTARKRHLAFSPIPTSPAFSADFTSRDQTHRGRRGRHYSVLQCALNGWNLFSILKHCRCNTLRSSVFNRSLMRDISLC